MFVWKSAIVSIFLVFVLGQFACHGNDDPLENEDDFGGDPCSKLYPTCLGCLDVSQQSKDDDDDNNQCVFQIRDSEITCVEIEQAFGIGPNVSAAILISVQDEAMCGLIESFIDTSFEDLEDPEDDLSSTSSPAENAEDFGEDYKIDNATLDESVPTIDESLGDEAADKSSSPPYYYSCAPLGFDFWTFFGGFFLGIGCSVLIQAFYSFYQMKKKSYNVPYQFDSFVNQ